jgi:hypothetical protein
MAPSLITTTSAASRSWWAAMASARFSLPISSSPSIRNLTLRGSSPSAASRASAPLTWANAWPLSSLAPRATITPSSITGSNGSLRHRSIGSGGCTS